MDWADSASVTISSWGNTYPCRLSPLEALLMTISSTSLSCHPLSALTSLRYQHQPPAKPSPGPIATQPAPPRVPDPHPTQDSTQLPQTPITKPSADTDVPLAVLASPAVLPECPAPPLNAQLHLLCPDQRSPLALRWLMDHHKKGLLELWTIQQTHWHLFFCFCFNHISLYHPHWYIATKELGGDRAESDSQALPGASTLRQGAGTSRARFIVFRLVSRFHHSVYMQSKLNWLNRCTGKMDRLLFTLLGILAWLMFGTLPLSYTETYTLFWGLFKKVFSKCPFSYISFNIYLTGLQEHTSKKCHFLHRDNVRRAFYKAQKVKNSPQRKVKGRRRREERKQRLA